MDLKYDRVLNHMREEDAGSGSLPVGVRADYTAFEVVANDAAIPAGSTDVVIGSGTVSFGITIDETSYGTAVDIPVGMTHEMGIKALDNSDIIVDWGDGGTTTKGGSPDSTITFNHTYTTPGKYTVKVYGRFSRIIPTSSQNLVYRVLDYDLPLAIEHVNLQEFARLSLRLVKVNFNDQIDPSRFSSLMRTFSGCSNLRQVKGMNRIAVASTCSGIFQDCVNLVSCEFQLPQICVVSPGTSDGNGHRRIFIANTQDAQWRLNGDLNDFFPDGGFAQEIVDLSNAFYHAGTGVVCYSEITLTSDSAAKLARKLWLAIGKKFIGYSDLFSRMPSAVRAYIPTAWGGTDSSVAIDTETGTVSGSSGGDLNIVTITGGSAVTIDATAGNRYEVIGAVPSITINAGAKSAKEIQVDFMLEGGTATDTVTFTGCTSTFGTVNFEGGSHYLASIQFATCGAVELQ